VLLASLEFDNEANALYPKLRKGKVASSEPPQVLNVLNAAAASERDAARHVGRLGDTLRNAPAETRHRLNGT
jgi:hypothetical protein